MRALRSLDRLLLAAACCLLQSPSCGADWPQWHGPNRDRQATFSADTPSSLPNELTPLWRIPVGGGHSSPVTAGGRVIYLDDTGGREVAHCVDAATGKELWHTPFAENNSDEWGSGPRSTPFLDAERVYVQSCRGEFRCLGLTNGKVLWGVSYEKDFGVKFLGPSPNTGSAVYRGHAGSGLVDGNHVILPVGATNGATIACFDKRAGALQWKAGQDEVAYSSLLVATLAGTRQVVAFTASSLMGVERDTGKMLWRTPVKTFANRHAATPIIDGDVVIVSSHTIGLLAVKVERAGDLLQASALWRNQVLKVNLATLTLASGFLYGQGARGDFVCVDAKTGDIRWSQPGFSSPGMRDYCSTVAGQGRLVVLTERGMLLLLEANPTRYTELGRVQACGSSWSFPALAGDRFYARDARELICYRSPFTAADGRSN